jgi:hypothetical protein
MGEGRHDFLQVMGDQIRVGFPGGTGWLSGPPDDGMLLSIVHSIREATASRYR